MGPHPGPEADPDRRAHHQLIDRAAYGSPFLEPDMTLNKDGLEPGQPVDFETMQRINRGRRRRPAEEPPKPKPRRQYKPDEAS